MAFLLFFVKKTKTKQLSALFLHCYFEATEICAWYKVNGNIIIFFFFCYLKGTLVICTYRVRPQCTEHHK